MIITFTLIEVRFKIGFANYNEYTVYIELQGQTNPFPQIGLHLQPGRLPHTLEGA